MPSKTRRRLGRLARALDVQQMRDALNSAVLDVREPGMKQLVAIHEQLMCLSAQHGQQMGDVQGAARIREYNVPLGEHLDRTIRTGTYCSYRPDPRVRGSWKV
jgi:hypothetical protein